MRKSVLTLSILGAASLAAQQPAAAPAAAWSAPAGWTIKTDGDKPAAETKFQTMGPGFHVTSGPAAIYFKDGDMATGTYTVKATFGQRAKPTMGHPEAYGVFIGGSDLGDNAKESYLYAEVRDDGNFYLAHRSGATVHKISDWSPNAALKKADEKGAASNEVGLQVTADSVHMWVNGVKVKSIAKGGMVKTDGQFGFRVNHMLNVHISNFGKSQ